MNIKKNILRTNLLISIVIIIGFICVQITTDSSFRQVFMQDIEYVSNLTSENMHMGIKELMSTPINVSLTMAHDTFLRDFMLDEENGAQNEERLNTIKNYLVAYKNKNQFDSVFLVSCKTQNYYHYQSGLDRVLSQNEEEDTWYYNFLNSPDDYSLNVDNDQATDNSITVFINCKLKDEKDNVIGVVGVGLKTPYVQQLLIENEKKYKIEANLVDDSGIVQISSTLTEFENVNLFTEPKYEPMKEEIVSNKTTTENQWYDVNQQKGFFVTRYIPYLNWYLVVEKNTDELYQNIIDQLYRNVLFIIIVLIVILSVVTLILKKNNRRITNLAEQDQLTGLSNRKSYERDIRKYEESDKCKALGIGIFDLNNLKKVNDINGHQEGDYYLKTVTDVAKKAFSSCPLYRIGGDEFCVIISKLDEETIVNNCKMIEQDLKIISQKKTYQMSVAFGYAFYDETVANTPEKIFKIADENMYLDKSNFKNSRNITQ